MFSVNRIPTLHPKFSPINRIFSGRNSVSNIFQLIISRSTSFLHNYALISFCQFQTAFKSSEEEWKQIEAIQLALALEESEAEMKVTI